MDSVTARDALMRPLPPDVVLGEFGTGLFYERYSAFSWSWTWRRTVLFSLIVVPCGSLFGVIHGLYAQDLAEGLAVAWRGVAANLLMIGLGPWLAAVTRQLVFDRRRERVLVVGSVLVGIIVTVIAWQYAEAFHDRLMGRPAVTASVFVRLFSGAVPAHGVVEYSAAIAADLALYAICSGVLGLRTFLGEPRRWEEHRERLALQAARQDKLEAERQLALLQAQVEPHFLFNTLASVRSLIQAQPQRAAQMIDALSEYLRSTVPRLRSESAAPASTLAEQFEVCRRFLVLMDLRLGGRLVVKLALPSTLANLPFPPLLLISLVENAVRHGVEPKVGQATIELQAREVERDGVAMIELAVRDDGVGLKEGLTEGTGLANVRGQLQVLFGEAAQFRVESRASGGVEATIAIPMQKASP